MRALGPEKRVTGIAMPGPFSADQSLEDARALAERLGIRFLTLPITAGFDLHLAQLQEVWGEHPFGVTEENLQARLRGVLLMSLANRENALVLVPANKSEFAMGYCTLYGDMVGALAPLSDLFKTEVYALARRHAMPARVLERAPTAELRRPPRPTRTRCRPTTSSTTSCGPTWKGDCGPRRSSRAATTEEIGPAASCAPSRKWSSSGSRPRRA